VVKVLDLKEGPEERQGGRREGTSNSDLKFPPIERGCAAATKDQGGEKPLIHPSKEKESLKQAAAQGR